MFVLPKIGKSGQKTINFVNFSKFLHVENQVYQWIMQKLSYQFYDYESHNPWHTW